MKPKLLLIILTIQFATARAQDLAAYNNYLDHFYIFDHGKSIKVEDLRANSWAIGGECVLYINSQGNLCLYKDSEVTKLEGGGVTKYFATDHLCAYSIFQKLKVVENRTPVTLSYNCPIYSVQDSMIVFYDEVKSSLRLYNKGQVTDIESGLLGFPITGVVLPDSSIGFFIAFGDNTVAYISSLTNDFKIWYNGSVNVILSNIGYLPFKAGRDIVAYINKLDNTFHAYYKGNDYVLENFVPKSYKIGDGFVAYVSNTGDFKVFYNGEISTLMSYAPTKYVISDNLLFFDDGNYFKAFWKGQTIELETFVPNVFSYDWNSLVYLDNTNRVWLFSDGEKKYLLNDLITYIKNYRDLIIMGAKINRTIIYYKGKTYEGSTM
jgi:hypothetical protein